MPKLRPLTVTIAPPVAGPLDPAANEAAGESKLNVFRAVPTVAATVIDSVSCVVLYAGAMHATAVALVHAEVEHSCPSRNEVVAVSSELAKLRPVTVTDVPPVLGAFVK